MLTVEKIGGTSMSQFQYVLKNIIVGKRKPSEFYNRIFVVSAYNNVTNYLLEHKKTGEPGIYGLFVNNDPYDYALDDLLQKLIEINKTFVDIKLDLNVAEAFIIQRIQQAKNYLDNLREVLSSGYVNKINILLAAREILASIGEAHSAFNTVNILNNNNIKAVFVDLCGFHDSEFLTIDERIHRNFQHINFDNVMPIATGYTKGTEGIMREFDRGYTEVTFSKIAVKVKADEAIIHKEFHLSSADPKIVGVDKSVPVGFTNYNVADQLADIGMEAIHPKASKPIEVSGINIRIKNTFEPDHPGTLITKDYIGQESKVEIITGSHKLIAIEIHDPLMVGEVGFDLGILEIFQRYRISYITKTTNANSITHIIWEKDSNAKLLAELNAKYDHVTIKPVAMVCVLGTNIAHPGILSNSAKALSKNKINIECVSQSLMQVNMQFVIDRKDFNKAIISLHKALIEN
ncbi:MAG: aspartate kinase [bacterium]